MIMAKKRKKKGIEQKDKKHPKIFCKNCESGNGYVRMKTGEFVCRDCGMITKLSGDSD